MLVASLLYSGLFSFVNCVLPMCIEDPSFFTISIVPLLYQHDQSLYDD